MGLTLREGNREYFYEQLDKHFDGLKEKYISMYKDDYVIMSPNNRELMSYFNEVCFENKIRNNTKEIFNFLNNFEDSNEQLSIF
jgi:hypothetical protein